MTHESDFERRLGSEITNGIATFIRLHEVHFVPNLPAPPDEWEDIVTLRAESAPGTISLRDIGIWTLLFCATLAAYLPALHGGFVWDDNGHVTRPDLQSLQGLWRIWFDLGATQQYYPLLHSAFWLEHRIWGDQVLGYHLINVALHVSSACLLMRILRQLSLPGAWLAGFVFALHPVCVEAVAWISEQKSALAGVFYLASALSYLHFDRTRSRSRYLLATGLFVLALLSKTVTATLPAALLVVFWWQRGRLEGKRDVRPLLPWFALSGAAGLLTAWVERVLIGAEGADFALTPLDRILLAGRVIWFYAVKLFLPVNLTFIYPHWKIDATVWWQFLFPAGILAVVTLLWMLARRHRGPLAGFLIFAGTLFPVLGFLNVYPFRFSYVADHFQYLACLGIIVPLTSALSAEAKRTWLGVALLAVLGFLTWRQSGMYQGAETLYRETLRRNPASWLAHNNLGFLLSQKSGQLPEAIAEYHAALEIKPDYAGGHLNLGNALSRTPGRLPEAIVEYEAALRIKPDYPEAHNGLGTALMDIPGRLPDSIAEYRAALRWKPSFAEAHNNLGLALSQTPGGLSEAIVEYEGALAIRPDNASTHYNLGIALSKIPGRSPDAIAHLETALRLRPDLQSARKKIEQLSTASR